MTDQGSAKPEGPANGTVRPETTQTGFDWIKLAGIVGVIAGVVAIIGVPTYAVTTISSTVAGLQTAIANSQSAANGRIDQLYPTILAQSKDINFIQVELKSASETAARAAGQVEVAAGKLTELTAKLTDLASRQENAIAKIDGQYQGIQDAVEKLREIAENQHDQLTRIELRLNANPAVPIKKTELFDGDIVFASPEYANVPASYWKELGIQKVVTFDNKDTQQADTIYNAFKNQGLSGKVVISAPNSPFTRALIDALTKQQK